MKNLLLLLLIILSGLSSCKTTNKTTETPVEKLDEIEVLGKKMEYRGSAFRAFDLIHTDLDVKFSWEKQHLFGEAILTLKPYFYPQSVLELDAKGMDLLSVGFILNDGSFLDLNYTYDDKIIKIDLNNTYTKSEKFKIYIKYVSKPNELTKADGLKAITDDKGLYFINPLGEEEDKPRQIWTQGEPESNSVWFPTIDKPNERCTQELTMTVENNFTAMSNGYISDSKDNGDGTYSVTWRQDKPHAPYLFMMAIGEFAEVKDRWKGMEVNYFVEDEFKSVAKDIFGDTPDMLTFFSDKLGVPYQWDKYWQVIVRDYVSGAMENTTAVIFGEFVQKNERELLDGNNEDIVAHELFHHWFGDLVTCESWSNLPLNESFATYGEVLWQEHKYGQDEKYLKLKGDMDSYFREAKSGKQVDLIRFNYEDPEDMFDSHSYAKGGVILNMLREIVGDDAFFASLQNYLWKNKYTSVEIHELRIAFEEITGQDLNWFFNQWFLSAGHPIVDVDYVYSDTSVIVKIKQEPSKEEYLVYTLPMAIDIHVGYNVRRENVLLTKKSQEFEFMTKVKPTLVNVDADNVLLAKFNDSKTDENYEAQFKNSTNLLDKVQALDYFAAQEEISDIGKMVFKNALKDEFWYVQEKALKLLDAEKLDANDERQIVSIAENSNKTRVQAQAIKLLGNQKKKINQGLFEDGINSQSYRINASSLVALSKINPKKAISKAEQWENVDSYEIIDAVGYVYSKEGDTSKKVYYQNFLSTSDMEYGKYYSMYHYSKFLGRMDDKTVLEGVSFIENWGQTDDGTYSKNVSKSALTRISNAFIIKADSYNEEIKNASGITSSQLTAMENEYSDMLLVIDRIKEATANIDKKK